MSLPAEKNLKKSIYCLLKQTEKGVIVPCFIFTLFPVSQDNRVKLALWKAQFTEDPLPKRDKQRGLLFTV